MRLLDWIYRAASLVILAIEIVERPGEGAQKKEEATDIIIEGLQALVSGGLIPGWVATVFGNKTFLGWLIDLMVNLANKSGFFVRSTQESAVSG